MSDLSINVLSEQQVETLHNATLRVLASTGVEMHLPQAVKRLKKAGAEVEGQRRVRIPAALVEAALASAPKGQTIYNRNGKEAINLGQNKTHYGTGPTTPMVIDPYTGQRRESHQNDIEQAARLCNALPNIDFVMSMGLSCGNHPQRYGVHPEFTDRLDFKAMLYNTTKPIIFSAWSLSGLRNIYEMAAAVAGDEESFIHKPFAIHYSEPSSPLVHSAEALQRLLFCAEKQMPLLYMGGALAGGTAPVTLAGQLVLSNAECLSGLVLHQLCSPGAPFIYGSGSNPMDLRTTLAPYCGPDAYLSYMASKSLADFYQLPDFNYGGISDANVMDGQMTWEAGFSLLQAELCGSKLVHDIGYLEAGMTACLELVVFCDEVIDELRHFKKGLIVDEERLAVEVIEQVGPGGSFLAHRHTLENFKSIWYPYLRNRSCFEAWQKSGGLDLNKKLNARVRHLLESHHPDPLPAAIQDQIDTLLCEAEKQYSG